MKRSVMSEVIMLVLVLSVGSAVIAALVIKMGATEFSLINWLKQVEGY